LILFACAAHARFRLIVAANRDEAYARPSAAAAFWQDAPHVHAGRDLEQGGTWLGLTRGGRFAAVTNYRQATGRMPGTRSRGELTREFLLGSDRADLYVQRVSKHGAEYNGFSLIVGVPTELYFYSNRGSVPARIAPGVHGLSNHLLDEPWPKVLRGIAVLKGLLGAEEGEIVRALSAMLADRELAPDGLLPATGRGQDHERLRSSAFIAAESYGTRASTIVLVRADGEVFFRETLYGPFGAALGTHDTRFTLDSEIYCSGD
jgi:uncharacterized protein with NRDE domain